MHPRIPFLLAGAAIAATCFLAPAAAGKNETWADTEGNRIKGEPAEVLGPFALFRTSARSSRLVLLSHLKAEDCVRFYRAIRDKSARAADWSQAKGDITRELFGRVTHVADGHLTSLDLKGRPEPEFIIVFFGDNNQGKSWSMTGWPASELYASLQKRYPGMVEALFWAPRAEVYEQEKMAVTMNMPWLVVDYGARMSLVRLQDLAPDRDFGITIISRDGVLVFASGGENEAAVRKVFMDLDVMLALMRPDNAKAWKDRAWYLQAIQPVVHANDQAPPVLVGDRLSGDALRKAGIEHLDAVIRVNAAGRPVKVTFPNGEKDLKEEMAIPVGDALMEGLFVPAVDHGKFVDGVFEYHFPAP